MGGVWKSKMPLLSTLAALVIIVHSAEENYEQDYREIRPRTLDVAPQDYDQSWRAMQIEPVTLQTSLRNQERWDTENQDQPMRRRRRKRKRRPNQEEISTQEDLYREASATQNEDNIDVPRRRRKKNYNQESTERNRVNWSEDGLERPLRRKGHRRKRPQIDSRPTLTEYNDFKQNNRPDSREETDYESRNDNKNENEPIEYKVKFNDDTESHRVEITTQAAEELYIKNKSQKEETVSEFSSESKRTEIILDTTVEETDKLNNKQSISSNVIEIPKDKKPLAPQTLKDILQKSNGKSLSEILQQNNLSLADLLHGKEKALSVLKKNNNVDSQETSRIRQPTTNVKNNLNIRFEGKEYSDTIDRRDRQRLLIEDSSEEVDDLQTTTDCSIGTETIFQSNTVSSKENIVSTETNPITKPKLNNNNATEENKTNHSLRRRFPVGARRRLRMRPQINNTNKGQLSRDLITLSSMKYKNNRTKSKEWKEILPTMLKRGQALKESIVETESNVEKVTFTTFVPEETTTELVLETTTDPSDIIVNTESSFYADNENAESLNAADSKRPEFKAEIFTTVASNEDMTRDIEVELEKPKTLPIIRPLRNSSELRRQAYNNRLKRRRFKQKMPTTEQPDDVRLKDIYGTSNYVSASEFIAKTRTTHSEQDDYSTLEDFMTTEATKSTEREVRYTKTTQKLTKYTSTTEIAPITTGETAKYEIEEILSDGIASAKLSKILKERNMTLMELVEHRERGSSHVHLADIFHNASREPNPPEPFLSKSLIEPISKETYPLRALLEASLHDAKTTTIDPNSNQNNNLNIPVVMDFGNNVNENGENMGIISLFNNFSRFESEQQNESYEKDTILNRSDEISDMKNKTARESRMLRTEKDLLSWNDLINLMQKNHQKDNIENENYITDDVSTIETPKKLTLEHDNDDNGEGLIMLEDLQRLKDFDSRITSDELLEIKVFENENQKSATNTVSSSNTKSVTVATVSIIGLALILFLLTYAILKWRQQDKIFNNKHSTKEECVPTPIFENRKGLKINSSTRSKSPMLASSNIYTIESIERAGSESPEYMWDSLRKPFQ